MAGLVTLSCAVQAGICGASDPDGDRQALDEAFDGTRVRASVGANPVAALFVRAQALVKGETTGRQGPEASASGAPSAAAAGGSPVARARRKLSINDPTPFGGYQTVQTAKHEVHVYKWSLSRRTLFQSAVLGLVAGPIIGFLLGSGMVWGIIGLALAPIVVDLLKPTRIYFKKR